MGPPKRSLGEVIKNAVLKSSDNLEEHISVSVKISVQFLFGNFIL